MEFERARMLMVESQVRTSDVTDPRLLAALRQTPRERFVPSARVSLAYADLEVEVAPGRPLLRPRELAKLIHALSPRPQERGLEIAGATGYGAAILASLMAEVVTLEPDPGLSFAAQGALASVGLENVMCVSTRIDAGFAEKAPYDVILLNGAAEIVPETWLDQLADGGRLGVIVREGPAGAARIYAKTGGAVAYRVAFDAAPAVLPGLEKPRRFVF